MGKNGRQARWILWTDEWDAYLRKKYPNQSNEKCLAGLRRKGYTGSIDSMRYRALNVLGVRKSPRYIAETSRRCIRICNEKRGADFAERQRQRALNDPNWWGGRRHKGPAISREELSRMAKANFGRKDVRERAAESRQRARRRDKRRLELGLDQLTRLQVESMGKKRWNIRSQMRCECGYITFPDDPRIYYDENTRRSKRREATAEDRGCYVYHISERGKYTTR
jgi:hypothetical protein